MESSIALACIGMSISLYGVVKYLQGILLGNTKPRMASWVAWLTSNTVFSAVAFYHGSYLATAINGVAALTNAAVIIASIRKNVPLKLYGANDYLCLTFSVVCVFITVSVPAEYKVVGAIFAALANVIATLPTVRHCWSKPHEETWQMFAATACAAGLGLTGVLVTAGVAFAAIAGPLVTTLGNIVLLTLTVGRRWIVVPNSPDTVMTARPESRSVG